MQKHSLLVRDRDAAVIPNALCCIPLLLFSTGSCRQSNGELYAAVSTGDAASWHHVPAKHDDARHATSSRPSHAAAPRPRTAADGACESSAIAAKPNRSDAGPDAEWDAHGTDATATSPASDAAADATAAADAAADATAADADTATDARYYVRTYCWKRERG